MNKRLITIMFLMLLTVPYILGQNFSPYYEQNTTLEGPNKDKDFSVATHITNTTLPYNGSVSPSVDTQTGTFSNVLVKDGSDWEVQDTIWPNEGYIYLNFSVEGFLFGSINAYCTAAGSFVNGTIDVWNGADWSYLGDIDTGTGMEWCNFSLTYLDTDGSNILYFRFWVDEDTISLLIDYAELYYEYDPIYDSWLDGWLYRKVVYLNGSSGAGTNYTVPIDVPYDSHMQSDYDDIRFTDKDQETILPCWKESYNATYALFWVHVYESLEIDTTIYMYYGNSLATAVSNGTTTFIIFEDWETQSVRADIWDIINANGGITYNGGTEHGYIAKFDANAGATYGLISDYEACSPLAVRFLSNIEEATTGNTARQGTGYPGAFGFAYIQTVSTGESFAVYDDLGNPDTQSMTLDYFDDWVTFEITRDGTDAKLYADSILIESASFDPDAVSTNPATCIYVIDSEDDLYNDWVLIRKFISAEPEFFGFGEEEDIGEEWHIINQFLIYLNIPLDLWGLHMLLIFGGLALIPVSVLYLVKGGKDDMNQNKFYYFCILFAMGIALFLGGIM